MSLDDAVDDLAMVCRNNRSKKFKDYSDPECNLDNKYDIVIGPIPDDFLEKILERAKMHIAGQNSI